MPLRDITCCQKVNSWYCSNSYFYFEIFYKTRQIYRVTSEADCYKWINSISAAIIYHNFWISIIDKHPYLENYLLRQRYENLEIKSEHKQEIMKKIVNSGLGIERNLKKSEISGVSEDNNKKIINEESKDSNANEKTKTGSLKKRRSNPYSQKGKFIKFK